MKKIFTALIALMLVIAATVAASGAAAPVASTSGPTSARAGETVTISLSLNGTGIMGFSGKVRYDSSQLTSFAMTNKLSSVWVMTTGEAFTAYSTDASMLASGTTTVLTVSFKIPSDVSPGTKISVTFTDLDSSIDFKAVSIAETTHTITVASPPSTVSTLSALRVTNAASGAAVAISPTFNSATTTYTANVEYAVSKVNIAATLTDSKAKVSISPDPTRQTLTDDGTTKFTITVTAENTDYKTTYTLNV